MALINPPENDRDMYYDNETFEMEPDYDPGSDTDSRRTSDTNRLSTSMNSNPGISVISSEPRRQFDDNFILKARGWNNPDTVSVSETNENAKKIYNHAPRPQQIPLKRIKAAPRIEVKPSFTNSVSHGNQRAPGVSRDNTLSIDGVSSIEDDDPFLGQSLNNLIRRRKLSSKKGSKRRRPSTRRGIIPGLENNEFMRRQRLLPSGGRGSENEDYMRLYNENQDESTEEEIFQNIKLQKDIIENIRTQPWRMRRKLKTLQLAKAYVEKYEGRLSRSHGYQEAGAKFWRMLKREATNFFILFIPWEMRIKRTESHFGSVVASFFIFLRWMFGVNLILALINVGFIMVPEIILGDPVGSTTRKTVPAEEMPHAMDLQTIWDFNGYLEYSPLFYGYYGNEKIIGSWYRLPLAYLLVGLATYGYSFVTVLRKMAHNARQSKLVSKGDQYNFSWKSFSTWDYMIGNAETAHNKFAAIATSFREVIIEEEEKKKEDNKYLLIFLRILANVFVLAVLGASAYTVYLVVERSQYFEEKVKVEGPDSVNWWEANEVAIVMSLITLLFPSVFDLIGMMEKYHPRVNLRWQLAR